MEVNVVESYKGIKKLTIIRKRIIEQNEYFVYFKNAA